MPWATVVTVVSISCAEEHSKLIAVQVSHYGKCKWNAGAGRHLSLTSVVWEQFGELVSRVVDNKWVFVNVWVLWMFKYSPGGTTWNTPPNAYFLWFYLFCIFNSIAQRNAFEFYSLLWPISFWKMFEMFLIIIIMMVYQSWQWAKSYLSPLQVVIFNIFIKSSPFWHYW